MASPLARQPWPNRAACWSTARPATGTGAPPNAVVSPTTASQSATAGSVSGAMPNASQAVADQVPASRSSSIVRDAVAASVTYPAPSRASSQLSVVVTTPSRVTCSRSQVIFGAAKYGSSGRPVIARSSAARSGPSRAQIDAERRSCQTIARLSGRPVAGSQASTVSPWLASATAWAGAPAWSRARLPAASTDRHSSSGSASTPSPSTGWVATGTSALPSTSLPGPTSSALVAEVP